MRPPSLPFRDRTTFRQCPHFPRAPRAGVDLHQGRQKQRVPRVRHGRDVEKRALRGDPAGNARLLLAARPQGHHPEHDVYRQREHLGGEPAMNERVLPEHDGQRNRGGEQQRVVHVRHDPHPAPPQQRRVADHPDPAHDEQRVARRGASDVDGLEQGVVEDHGSSLTCIKVGAARAAHDPPEARQSHVKSSTLPQRGPGAASMSRDGVKTVALVVLCQVAHFLTFAALPLLLPAIREDLAISFTQAGMLAAAGSLSYACTQIPAGYLSDRYGPRRLFFAGLLGWSALSLAFGTIHAFWLALANQFVAGAFRALLFAPGLALLASWFPPGRRATAMSLFLFGGHAGSVLLSLAGPFLAERYGWRATFIAFAAAGIVAACLFGLYASERPQPRGLKPISARDFLELARFPI